MAPTNETNSPNDSSQFQGSELLIPPTATENMETTIQKISMERRTDTDLIAYFQESGKCTITWQQPKKGEENRPPVNAIAVVVDVPDNKGAIRVYKKASDTESKHIGTVGTEYAGHMVIIPWAEHTWWFRLSGSLMVGYVVAEA
ncbi:hypothetical protein BKA67DRAFT_120990 [Truncatella angustata]|uniref:Uncharacterized protein n=1 Tax=Truncatella angustata TaxID=152316 RepID=A0A9P8RKC8_9PEZI|nr:uncharacterized protein BKA67DRAFT_120990 [Truncatella angustata]KAH6645646.1 hypothetical protein BKA67DRAFT_120990 [Truncatella angustata]